MGTFPTPHDSVILAGGRVGLARIFVGCVNRQFWHTPAVHAKGTSITHMMRYVTRRVRYLRSGKLKALTRVHWSPCVRLRHARPSSRAFAAPSMTPISCAKRRGLGLVRKKYASFFLFVLFQRHNRQPVKPQKMRAVAGVRSSLSSSSRALSFVLCLIFAGTQSISQPHLFLCADLFFFIIGIKCLLHRYIFLNQNTYY